MLTYNTFFFNNAHSMYSALTITLLFYTTDKLHVLALGNLTSYTTRLKEGRREPTKSLSILAYGLIEHGIR